MAEISFKWRATADGLKEGDGQRIFIRARIGCFTDNQFGRQVKCRPYDRASVGVLFAACDFHDTKIHEDRLTLRVDHDVGRLDIPVDQAALVGISGSITNVQNDTDGITQEHALTALIQLTQTLLQRFPLHNS